MINIVHLQYSTKSAGCGALRLQNVFLNANINSVILSLQKDASSIGGIKYLDNKSRLIAKVDSKIQSFLTRNSTSEFGLFSYPILGTNVAQLEEIKEADIIYIHWTLNGFLNLRNLRQLARLRKPIVIFMHDMWNITGGCHYSFSCEKYVLGCHSCQMFTNRSENDISAKGFNNKMKLYSKYNNLYFVSPSRWLFDCANKSYLVGGKPLFYIPNVVDNILFKPFDKKVAKEILNINTNEKVIAFGAVKVDSPYKGWSYLLKALEILKADKDLEEISILIFGSGFNKNIADEIPFKTKFLGYLSDEYSISVVFNAADVFVVPSLADNQPTTIMESLCCGTPVVGFDVGGIPDMINHKKNGYLAKYKDDKDIANGIKYCLVNNLQGYILPEFEPAAVLNMHLKLFDFVKSNNKINDK